MSPPAVRAGGELMVWTDERGGGVGPGDRRLACARAGGCSSHPHPAGSCGPAPTSSTSTRRSPSIPPRAPPGRSRSAPRSAPRTGRRRVGGRPRRGGPERRHLCPGHRYLGGCPAERALPSGCRRGVDRDQLFAADYLMQARGLRPADRHVDVVSRTAVAVLRVRSPDPLLAGRPLSTIVRVWHPWDPARAVLAADRAARSALRRRCRFDRRRGIRGDRYGVYRLAAARSSCNPAGWPSAPASSTCPMAGR